MKALLKRLAVTSARSADLGLLLLRLTFGITMAASHGYGKVMNLGDFSATVASKGIPLASVLGPLAGLGEFLGGVLVAVGLFTRIGAAAILCTMLVAAFHIHAADPFGRKELALLYAFASLAILLSGPGRYSLDHRLLHRS